MKVSELWLREWVNPNLTREALCNRLTLSGLEIESVMQVAGEFSGVVVGHILKIEKHPEADRLNICEVDVGAKENLQIVCGASNVTVGMKVPAALDGAMLPNNLKIKVTKLRGVTSYGMLCSATELGFTEESKGLFELPRNAVPGENVWEYLNLSDHILEINITPNRGDCLSLKGLSKDIAVLTDTKQTVLEISPNKEKIKDTLSITLEAAEDCPHYVGRIIRNVQADAITPVWLQERLRRSGVRCISPIVDVMNYVMLELGQPMHSFDLGKISEKIIVRKAKNSERLELLDGQTVDLNNEVLVIADREKPLAMAGVMGGLESSVTLLTKDIFLESAYFKPATVTKTVRKYHLNSESAYRYERGIDPEIQVAAIERATQLILQIAGGEPGPVINAVEKKFLPQPTIISLRKERVCKILGVKIENDFIEKTLHQFGFTCEKTKDGWNVTVPPRRSDLALEIDLIEEIMRVYGTEHLPIRDYTAPLKTFKCPENRLTLQTLRRSLCDLGYHEVVTYSFVDSNLQRLLNPQHSPKPLLNPISSDMDVMRTNLWPGLVKTMLFNQNRQQNRVRIFETGLRFIPNQNSYLQERVIAGLITGDVLPEQWGCPKRAADFFDLKGNLQDLFKLTRHAEDFIFKKGEHSALHPGQTAEIFRGNELIGICGALHPEILQSLDVTGKVFVFELKLDVLEQAHFPQSVEISKFPEIRRDLALIVDQAIPSAAIQATIIETAKELLKDIFVFDVYQGKGIVEGCKSIAIALTLQHSSRTLVDEEVADLMNRVIVALKGKFKAELRG